MTQGRLRLIAQDTEDLQVISACLQDSLTSVADIAYATRRRRFAAMLRRFRWEEVAGRRIRLGGQRIRTALHFDYVDQVRSRGIAQDDRQGLLPLLAITSEPAGDGVKISLRFAGGGVIDMTAECIDAQLTDLGDPWLTTRRPDHEFDRQS